VVGVTADSNIYISALNFGGPSDKLLDMARAGEIELHISDDILGEVLRVLREKFRWTDEALMLTKDRIGDFTVVRIGIASCGRDVAPPFMAEPSGDGKRTVIRDGA
jgi:hypothetical protein